MLKRPLPIRVSLANKCQLLFGLAVVLILTAALTVVSWRMQGLVMRGPEKRAQDLAELWLSGQVRFTEPGQESAEGAGTGGVDTAGVIVTLVTADQFASASANNTFLESAIERFEAVPDAVERFEQAVDSTGRRFFRYARAVRLEDLQRRAGLPATDATPPADAASEAVDALEGVLLIQLRDNEVSVQQTLNRLYAIAAGLVSGLLAIAVFWYITTRLILSPVRVLKGYAERVGAGDLSIRSDINTGDEFEQLSDVFNQMLETLKTKQDQLRAANKTLDLQLEEMGEKNVALYEANKVKGEFLANVSHELRTPLNSIIGFAEVLQETLADRTGPMDEKRKRYASNIIISSRRLLELINELLDLAKIEAGRMEINLATVSVRDTCEGMVTLIRPQADGRQVELRLKVEPNLPMVETDPGKLQQVVFNFLSNAVKFSPPSGVVTVTAKLLPAESDRGPAFVRIAVSDQGPGIAREDQQRIFEKFTQLDNSVTKQHAGTGLGLTIVKELTDLLHGRIELDSTPGQGATFGVVLPLVFPIDRDSAEHAEKPGDATAVGVAFAGGSAAP